MGEQNRKKIFIIIILAVILVIIFTMFVFSKEVSETLEEFIQNIASQKDIDEEDIKKIKDINLDNPPEGVVLGEVHSSDLNIYEVEIEGEDRPVFVISLRS